MMPVRYVSLRKYPTPRLAGQEPRPAATGTLAAGVDEAEHREGHGDAAECGRGRRGGTGHRMVHRRPDGRRGRRGGGGRGGRLERADQRPHRGDLAVRGEAPVEQGLGGGDLGQRRAVQQGHDERDAVPPGHPDVRGARGAGPADLAADSPGVAGQQGVLVVQPDLLVPLYLEQPAGRLVVLQERGHPQRLPGEQGQVVGGGVLARGVQAVRVDGDGVVRLQVPRLGVDQRHALPVGPHRLGQRDRRVVGRDGQQRGEQRGDLVRVPGQQAHDVRHGRGGQLAGDDQGIRVEQRDQRDRGEHLERAGRQVPAVRVLGREHLPGAGVRDDERRGVHAGQPRHPWRRVDDHAPAGQLRSADGLRQVGRGRSAGGRGRGPSAGRTASRTAGRDTGRGGGRSRGGGRGRDRGQRQQGARRGERRPPRVPVRHQPASSRPGWSNQPRVNLG